MGAAVDIQNEGLPLSVLQLQSGDGWRGGIAFYISELLRSPALENTEFRVVVAEGKDGARGQTKLYGRHQTVQLPESYTIRSFPSYVQRLIKIAKENDVDLIHAHALRSALAGAVVSRLTGIPLVYTNHGLRYTQPMASWRKSLLRWADNFVNRSARFVCPIRPHDYRVLTDANPGPEMRERIRLVRTRLRRSVKSISADVHQRFGGRPTFVGVGSLIPVKRPDRFLDWVAALRSSGLDFRAKWYGDGPLRSKLEKRVQDENLPVEFVGHVGREELDQGLGEATLLFLSSEFEVFPLSVLDAYAQGLPVVAGRFPGVNDFVDSSTGRLVDPDVAKEVALQVQDLLSDPRQLEDMSRNALKMFIDQFANADAMAAAYSEIYHSSVESPPPGSSPWAFESFWAWASTDHSWK